mmetsp:Transcript_44326/g.141968  ORF Transcript_44326/g.141968 Transcript_44326/m.141968 type:complete len:340 (-) Transcript_44326:1030-2049(-)
MPLTVLMLTTSSCGRSRRRVRGKMSVSKSPMPACCVGPRERAVGPKEILVVTEFKLQAHRHQRDHLFFVSSCLMLAVMTECTHCVIPAQAGSQNASNLVHSRREPKTTTAVQHIIEVQCVKPVRTVLHTMTLVAMAVNSQAYMFGMSISGKIGMKLAATNIGFTKGQPLHLLTHFHTVTFPRKKLFADPAMEIFGAPKITGIMVWELLRAKACMRVVVMHLRPGTYRMSPSITVSFLDMQSFGSGKKGNQRQNFRRHSSPQTRPICGNHHPRHRVHRNLHPCPTRSSILLAALLHRPMPLHEVTLPALMGMQRNGLPAKPYARNLPMSSQERRLVIVCV